MASTLNKLVAHVRLKSFVLCRNDCIVCRWMVSPLNAFVCFFSESQPLHKNNRDPCKLMTSLLRSAFPSDTLGFSRLVALCADEPPLDTMYTKMKFQMIAGLVIALLASLSLLLFWFGDTKNTRTLPIATLVVGYASNQSLWCIKLAQVEKIVNNLMPWKNN